MIPARREARDREALLREHSRPSSCCFRHAPTSRDEADTELPTLPANPFDLFSQGNVYWAGNLNVFIGGQAVERHRASELRIHPQQTNVVMFFVGNGQPDSYRFDIVGVDRRWEATLSGLVRRLFADR